MAQKPRFNVKNNTDDPVLILMHFRWKQKRITISTGEAVPQKYWNKKAGRVRENRGFPHYAALNALFDQWETTTKALVLEFKLSGGMPAPHEFKEALLIRLGLKPEEEKENLFAAFEKYIETRRATGSPKGSLQVYINTLKQLQAYSDNRKRPLDFPDLNEAFKDDFLSFLQAQNFTDSYIHKVFTNIKTFLRKIGKRSQAEIVSNIGVRKRSGDKIYLAEREIEALAKLELSPGSALDRARDWFLIGCLTGQRYSDYHKLTPENIQMAQHEGKEVECWVCVQEKTKAKVIIPLVNPTLRRIIEKHSQTAPTPPPNVKINKALKELAQMAGITDKVAISEYKGGRHDRKVYAKWELVTTHTGRRSFCTNAYKRGMNPIDIAKFSGHTSVKALMDYLKLGNEEVAVMLSDHKFFTGTTDEKGTGA